MVLFNTAWLVCVYLRLPWALAAALVVVAFQLVYLRPHPFEWRAVAVVTILGTCVDSVLTAVGLYDFTESWSGGAASWLIPLWFISLWVVFGATINTSMRFFAPRVVLSIVAGMIAGPSAYYAGSKLGAVQFGLPLTTTLIVIAVVWAVLFPALVHLAAWAGEVDDRYSDWNSPR